MLLLLNYRQAIPYQQYGNQTHRPEEKITETGDKREKTPPDWPPSPVINYHWSPAVHTIFLFLVFNFSPTPHAFVSRRFFPFAFLLSSFLLSLFLFLSSLSSPLSCFFAVCSPSSSSPSSFPSFPPLHHHERHHSPHHQGYVVFPLSAPSTTLPSPRCLPHLLFSSQSPNLLSRSVQWINARL